MIVRGENLIGGETSAAGPRSLRAVNPVTRETLEPGFPEATTGEADRAVESASGSFEAYRAASADQRADFLDRIAVEIEALGDALIERAAAESGLPVARLTGERGRTAGQLRMFAGVVREGSWVGARIDRALPDRQPLPKPDLRRMLIPMGPVVVFGASNFPLAFSVCGGDTASALAAGCPVVVKAHPAHPGTSELVGRAVVAAAEASGMPAGVFSLVHGAGHDTGLHLVGHPLTKAVAFTGSLKGGRALFDAAASRPEPVPVYAEMGSTNPVFVLPGAARNAAAEFSAGLAGSVTLGVGQFCTNPGVVVMMKDPSSAALLNSMKDAFAGTSPGTMLHEGIRQNFQAGVDRLRATPGVEELAHSGTAADPGKTEAGAVVFTTTAETWLRTPALAEEVFGPSTVVISCGDPQEMENLARRLEGHLTATLHGTPEDLADHNGLVSILENRVGRLIFNGFPTGVEVCPSMQHGGPYPATTDSRTTSVGTAAIERFARPVCYQDFPQASLPTELRDRNERGLWRLLDNAWTQDDA